MQEVSGSIPLSSTKPFPSPEKLKTGAKIQFAAERVNGKLTVTQVK
jgi:Cu/Ag efflux protein CusF